MASNIYKFIWCIEDNIFLLNNIVCKLVYIQPIWQKIMFMLHIIDYLRDNYFGDPIAWFDFLNKFLLLMYNLIFISMNMKKSFFSLVQLWNEVLNTTYLDCGKTSIHGPPRYVLHWIVKEWYIFFNKIASKMDPTRQFRTMVANDREEYNKENDFSYDCVELYFKC